MFWNMPSLQSIFFTSLLISQCFFLPPLPFHPLYFCTSSVIILPCATSLNGLNSFLPVIYSWTGQMHSSGLSSSIIWHYFIPPLSLQHRGLDTDDLYSLFRYSASCGDGKRGLGQGAAANRISCLQSLSLQLCWLPWLWGAALPASEGCPFMCRMLTYLQDSRIQRCYCTCL